MSTCESAETNGRLVVFASLTQREPVAATPSDAAPMADDSAPAGVRTASFANGDPVAPQAPDAPRGDSQPSASTDGSGEPGPSAPDEPQPAPADDANGATPATETIVDNANPLAASPDAAADEPTPAGEEIADNAIPLANVFRPTGGSYSSGWALLNLLCSLLSLFMLLPPGSLKDKYRRARTMREANEQGGTYERERFSRRLAIGVGVEVVLAAGALLAFFLTGDFSAPMVLIDAWTPLMLAFPVLSVITDIRLARYRSKLDAQEEENGDAVMQRQVAGA